MKQDAGGMGQETLERRQEAGDKIIRQGEVEGHLQNGSRGKGQEAFLK